MNIALCISGQLRSFNNNKDSIINCYVNNLKQYGNVHIFSATDKTISLNTVKSVIIESQMFFNANIMQQLIALAARPDIPYNIINMYYKIYKCNQLKNEFERENNFKYDIAIRVRPDMAPHGQLILEKNNNTVYFPKNLDYDGVCDQFAYGDSQTMDVYSDMYNNILNTLKSGCRFTAEIILKQYCNDSKINIQRINNDFNIGEINRLL